MKVKTKTINDYSPAEIGWLSRSTLEVFEERAANLMATFDATAVYSAIASYLRLEGLEAIKNDFDLRSLLKVTQRAFLTLLKRGALDAFVRFPISPEGQQELDNMNLAVYGDLIPTTGDSSSDPTPTPAPEELLAEQVVQDWNSLPADEIRKKKARIPGYGAAVEHAVASGLI